MSLDSSKSRSGATDPPTRSTLIRDLRNPEIQERAWFEFQANYAGLIRGFAVKIGVQPDDLDDVLQEVLLNVFKHIADFQHQRGKCSFRTWLLNAVKWRVLDRQRRTARPTVDSSLIAAAVESAWDDEWKAYILRLAIRQLRASLPPMQFQVFEMVELNLLGKGEVAGRLGVSVAQIYLINHRVRKKLKQICRQLEVRLDGSEMSGDLGAHPAS